MLERAVSKTYGENELKTDCNALRDFFCTNSEPDQSHATQSARVRSSSAACLQAQALVEKHIGKVLQELEAQAGLSQSVMNGSAGAQQEAPRPSQDMHSEEDIQFFNNFQPILDYNIPGRSDPLEDPMISVINYTQLLERAGTAPLEVLCFKSTEPENLFNTIRGEIDARGFLKWRVVPISPAHKTIQPHLFFQVSRSHDTKNATVNEADVLQPMTFDAPEPAGSPMNSFDERISPELDSCIDAGIEPRADPENLSAFEIPVVPKSPAISSSESQFPGGSALSSAVDRQRRPQIVLHPVEVSEENENASGCSMTPAHRLQQRKNLKRQDHVQQCRNMPRDSVVHSAMVRKVSDLSGAVPAAQGGVDTDLELEDRGCESSDGNEGACDDAGSEWSGAEGDSESEYESKEDNNSNASDMSGSCVHSDEETGYRTESDEFCVTSSAREGSSATRKRLRRKAIVPTDPNKIEEDNTLIEHHCREVRADRSVPLTTLITEKNYTDPSRDRPAKCPQIPKDSMVRGCQPGDILAVPNTYLKESINFNFFDKFGPLSFHICLVVFNDDEAEELTLRRLTPLTIFGQTCLHAARTGGLQLGPVVYSLKEIEAASEGHIILKIKHDADAEKAAILTTLSASSAGSKRDNEDYRKLDEAGILVLCDAGKRKIAHELISRGRTGGMSSAMNDPQLKPWEAVRKKLTLDRFFDWADEYHENKSTDGVNREIVSRSLLYLDLTADVQQSVGDKTAFVTNSKKSDSDCSPALRAAIGNMDSILQRIAEGVERVVLESGGGGCGKSSGPLDQVSHWTTLFCIQESLKGSGKVAKKQGAETPDNFHSRFLNFCSQSLEYYVDADVAVFCSAERPTHGSHFKDEFGFVICAWDVQVISTSLQRSCRLQVLRGEKRISYKPCKPGDLNLAVAPPSQDLDR
jgi:hypothetical protein